VNCSTLSHDSVTYSRSPEVSSIAFHAQPLDLPPVLLMDVGFAILCSLARHRRPPIQFLFIGSRVCSALLSDLASRRRPCASLPFTSIRLGRDFHPLAAEHARRTTKKGPLRGPSFSQLRTLRKVTTRLVAPSRLLGRSRRRGSSA
jgi:hypothetical protein